MTKESLGYINNEIRGLGIPYEFMGWTKPHVPNTYWVGQYTEAPTTDEGGESEADFILIGTTKNRFLDLENVKETLKSHFPVYGRSGILSNGQGIAVMYDNAFPIPSVDATIKRIQITLRVKEYATE